MYPAKDIQLHLSGSSDPVHRLHKRFLDTPGAARPQELDHSSRADFAVITLGDGSDNISSVQYQAFRTSAPGPVDNVENFHYIPTCTKKVQPDSYYFGCSKAGLKAQKSLTKVFAFLSGNTGERTTEIAVGESAIVERLEIMGKKGEKILHEGGQVMVNFTQFCEIKCKIKLPYPTPLSATPSEVESNYTQFFNLRSSNLRARHKIEEFSSVTILSGMCLFSQEHLGYLHGESASPPDDAGTTPAKLSENLVPLPLDRRPTLYEIESLVRLPNAVADIVSILPTTVDITVTLEVPQVQYYAFLLELFAAGRCSREHLNSWLEIIDTRHNQIAVVFKKALRNALQRRGINRKNVQIELSTGLEDLIPYIRQTIDEGNAPSVENLLQELLKLNPLFKDYYGTLLELQPPPQNIVNLCYTSYTYQVLRPVFQHVRESQSLGLNAQNNTPNRQLLVVIDNPAEWRVYSQVEKVLGEYQKKHSSIINPLILGIFPSELIFTAENTQRASLYLRNPGQYIYDESEGRIVGPNDIVERVYGTEATQKVVGWMRQEGMFNMSGILAISNDGFSSSGESSSGRHGTSSPATSWNSREGSPRISGQKFGGKEVGGTLEILSLSR